MGDIHGVNSPTRRGLILRAFVTSVLLSLLFIVVYGGTNWLTAQRPAHQVATWYLTWELSFIPFVPWLVIPYMSIDLFFFGAAFLCRTDRERVVFVQRVVFSIAVATTFFLLMPLKLVWPARPGVSGWLGDFVETSCTAPFLMEYPHNLFPSLHVTLCAIIADMYGRHTRGTLRVLLHLWFFLIAVSTILTWQHHLVDLAGGMVLAGFAFYLFRESKSRLPVVINIRIGSYYAAGAVLVLALVPLIWPWGVFMLWPAAALGINAGAYFGMGPGNYRKTDGSLPISSTFVLAPVLIGQYLSLVYYRRQCRACDHVTPNVIIGRQLTNSESVEVMNRGVTAVLDLTSEFSETKPFLKINYRNLQILDLSAPTLDQLHEASSFIEEAHTNGIVYVHCKIGYSRSAAAVVAFLLTRNKVASVNEAIVLLRQIRPSIIIRPEVIQALHTFAASVSDANKDRQGETPCPFQLFNLRQSA